MLKSKIFEPISPTLSYILFLKFTFALSSLIFARAPSFCSLSLFKHFIFFFNISPGLLSIITQLQSQRLINVIVQCS